MNKEELIKSTKWKNKVEDYISYNLGVFVQIFDVYCPLFTRDLLLNILHTGKIINKPVNSIDIRFNPKFCNDSLFHLCLEGLSSIYINF